MCTTYSARHKIFISGLNACGNGGGYYAYMNSKNAVVLTCGFEIDQKIINMTS